MKRLFYFFISLILISSCRYDYKKITIDTLLREMSNRDYMAEYPEPVFKLKQESSYNRASVSPKDSMGWFMNNDFNSKPTDRNFLRIDTINGNKEWVLMDHNAPGVIVRTWMPFSKPDVSDTDAIIRVYLDGSSAPVIEGNMMEVFNGDGFIPYPFAHKSLRSAVSFFPIPYSKSCKVTTSKCPSFYQITYREYPVGTDIKTFTMQDFERSKDLIAETSEILLYGDGEKLLSVDDKYSSDVLLKKGKSVDIDLVSENSAISCIKIKMNPKLLCDSTFLRNIFLAISFDGVRTVYSNFSDFWGCGVGLNPFQDRYREVLGTGVFFCKWVMPFKDSARITLLNNSSIDFNVDLSVSYKDYEWTENTMYFHSSCKYDSDVHTRPFSDWNYISIKGKGVYVGDALTIFNPVERWWGEGDEKIWVDNDSFPSLFGTGTEDYYGYSWGGISTDFYEHPFHAQPASNRYNKLNRKYNIKEKNTQGYSTEVRVRALDGIVFNNSLKLDMEVWSWTDCVMEYSVGTYWYELPHNF